MKHRKSETISPKEIKTILFNRDKENMKIKIK